MSNNQMVSVPREQLAKVREWIESARDGVLYPIARDFDCVIGRNAEGLGQGTPELLDLIDGLLAAPAEQHQGEPVVLPERRDADSYHSRIGRCATAGMLANEWNACLDELAKLGPLYTRPAQVDVVGWQFCQQGKWWNGDDRIKDHRKNTEAAGIATRDVYTHADPAEVERLRENAKSLAADLAASLKQQCADIRTIDALRAQLAERDALIADVLIAFQLDVEGRGSCQNPGLDFIRPWSERVGALSASAEPSAAAEIDERAEFERRYPDFDHTLCSHEDWKDQYEDPKLGDMWNGWQARAALERKP